MVQRSADGHDGRGRSAAATALHLGIKAVVTVRNAIAGARRHATAYLDGEYTADPAERERLLRLLLAQAGEIVRPGPEVPASTSSVFELDVVDLAPTWWADRTPFTSSSAPTAGRSR